MPYAPIARPVPPTQIVGLQLTTLDAQVDQLVRVLDARRVFSVDGEGLSVAVLDTGVRATHVDFKDKIKVALNFTQDNGGNKNDATDGDGHGTNVAGIIVANGLHKGVAPGAGLVPMKVLGNTGGGSFTAVEQALDWVLENATTRGVSVVSMSLGAATNDDTDAPYRGDGIQQRIAKLRAMDIPVVIAAGNDYFRFQQQGMGYPAIIHECVSVGAVFDAEEGPFSYQSGAQAFSSKADQITPFSQRLSYRKNPIAYTDIFAPGAPITSSGIASDTGESIQHGTSQATPVVSGVILLLQQYFKRFLNRLPPVALLQQCLRLGAVQILDGDDENDNVAHTNMKYRRVDALGALRALHRQMRRAVVTETEPMPEAAAGVRAMFTAQSRVVPESAAKFAFDRILVKD